MSSRPFITLVLSCALGCAAFTRGEYWDGETDGEGGAGPGGEAEGGSANPTTGKPPGDTSDGPDTTGESGGPGTEGSSGAPAGPSFAQDVLPLLIAGCERCHTSTGAANTTSFLLDVDPDTAYEMVLQFIDVDAPANSRLLAKTAGQGHTGGVIFDSRSPEYEEILSWIEHGALP